ncbi:beta-ketoacyl-ACP reductase [Clostridium aminobutyricum]|uniref:Beta-ketoacyl-ACP reductase n=1 Tax=Clostridium aminobutyricum TaxID=33953 RepID=A0A939IGX4_CLOAM|nr:beta-ketoacyl-ACP reductase [Clostridium aminobutyricum]MBN7774100.1 beta-ketoacyl-ACP reductase [Clostridium aminobutyricum]
MKGLNEKVVIITGGTKGIGKATALRFAEEGSKVIITGRADGTAVADAMKDQGDVCYMKVDVSDLESCKLLAKQVIDKYGRIDVLINNAGVTKDATMKKMTQEQWDDVIAINLTGTFNCTSAVLPTMLEQSSGVVINTSSVVGLFGNQGQTNYAATKWGVIGMTKTWAKEMAKKGLRFNCVAPGFIGTEMVGKIPEDVLKEKILVKIPAGRLGEPEEIASAFAFLASDEAKYINGAVLSVDGAAVL